MTLSRPALLSRRSAALTLAVAGLSVCFAGCGSSVSVGGSGSTKPETKREGPVQVVATIGMVADLARNVGGEHVEVTQMLGPGVDPHLYKATRDDVKTLSEAEVVFYSGLMLEGQMADVLVKMARTRPVVPVTESIDVETLLEPEEFEGQYDPHVWNDVSAWSQAVDAVVTALSEFDPDHADEFAANGKAYQEKLSELHEYGKKVIATVPEDRRLLITSHDAFNYLAEAYDLNVSAVQGISTESEAGLQQIASLVDTLVEKKVEAVFIESSVPRKSIDSLVEGAKAEGHNVTVGGELFSDATGPDGTYEGTYIGMLDHNLTLIARGLGGEAPEKGFQGKLGEAADE
ncbi:MAG: zinc ABC transporter substrate-binding protein [Planctomycetota bacterium]